MPNNSVYSSIVQFLNSSNTDFSEVHHPPCRTSEQSAEARGESIEIGGKAILLKCDDTFYLFVLSAAKKLDSKAIKKRLNLKKTRFATAEELLELTGLVPGSVPPFGKPILPFELFLDHSITDNETIAFNAGSLTDSIILRV